MRRLLGFFWPAAGLHEELYVHECRMSVRYAVTLQASTFLNRIVAGFHLACVSGRVACSEVRSTQFEAAQPAGLA